MATCQTSALTAGTHTITAVYSGDGNFLTSTGTLSPNQVLNNLPLVSFTAANYNVNESDGVVHVIVTRVGDITVPFNVGYATSDSGASTNCAALNTGLASSACDYTAFSGTLNFAANQATANIDIPINQDSYTEGPESFAATLVNATNGAVLVGPATTIITINDSAAPAGGALTVNGVSATAVTPVSYDTDGSFAIDGRTDYSEGGGESGLASSTLVRASASFSTPATRTPGR